MGLSASQARLLSITARISDNELHSQQIANSKMRLADKTQEASSEYVKALDTQKLVYTTYDAKGNTTQQALTPALMYEYSDLKNQYGISNTSGQLLISKSDAEHYLNSNSLKTYLESYGISPIKNELFDDALINIYGENFEGIYHDEKKYEYFEGTSYYDTFLNKIKTITPTEGDDLYNFRTNDRSAFLSGLNAITLIKNTYADTTTVGYFSNYVDTLYAIPSFTENPPSKPSPVPRNYPTKPDFASLAAAYNGSQCHDSVTDNATGIAHMEHNLAALMWTVGGAGVSSREIKNTAGTITIHDYESAVGSNYGFSLTNYNFYDKDDTGQELNEKFNACSEYTSVKAIRQQAVDLYCDVINYLVKANKVDSTKGSYYLHDQGNSTWTMTLSGSVPAKDASDLLEAWEDFYDALEELGEEGGPGDVEYQAKRDAIDKAAEAQDLANEQEWQRKMEAYNKRQENFINGDLKDWITSVENALKLYKKHLDEIPERTVVDKQNPKSQWYINLWHRLNGEEYGENRVGQAADGTQGRLWKVLDDNLYSSTSWIQYALEQGIVSIEQVQYQNPAEDQTGLDFTTWKTKVYTTCQDIMFVDDEVAIAKAEAEYTKKLKEIEAKDKKYDNDIKKLDTEHNALQTEYESVKSVVDKNIERSFKAFS